MGAAARQRALGTFHPNVVMHQIEALFQELQERRLQPSQSFPVPSSPSPQLDLVRAFASYATAGEAHLVKRSGLDTLESLAAPVRALRGPLWDFLRESLPVERHDELIHDLLRKHTFTTRS